MYKIFSLNNKLKQYLTIDLDKLYILLNTSSKGLKFNQILLQRKNFGDNNFNNLDHSFTKQHLYRAFFNPFTIILYIISIISIITDIIYPIQLHQNYSTITIIIIMIILSVIIRFSYEQRSFYRLSKMDTFLNNYIAVKRNNKWIDIPIKNLVVGDYVYLTANTKVPADIRLIKTNSLFVSQAILTGESDIIEKHSDIKNLDNMTITNYSNLAFMGTSIISGSGEGIVLNVGTNTLYGSFAQNKTSKITSTSFFKDANSISLTLIKFMAILIPIVSIISILVHGSLLYSFVFALSIAIGLTPELLPMIITTCLVKGSNYLSKQKIILKDIYAMQCFGSMDILCVDKTGTLTSNNIILEYYLDILGNENQKTLDFAYLNSYHLSSYPNHIDNAILKYATIPQKKDYFQQLINENKRISEIPFNFERKCSSVIIQNEHQKLLITKGDVKELFKRCQYIEYQNKILPIDNKNTQSIHAVIDEMLEDGMKVMAVAYKPLIDTTSIDLESENNLILIGYLAFFDAPKKSSIEAIKKLQSLNVNIKLLTGDNVSVATSICKRVGISTTDIITGNELSNLNPAQLDKLIEKTTIFAELTPDQKRMIITSLQQNGHTVGFLGDGLNDIPAIVEADIGISINEATDSTKDVANVILCQKDLTILHKAIIEGRKTFTNITKYIKITASSNFGNIFSIICASAFLPFLPMTAIQLLLLNILYDILCLILPWDKIDNENYRLPLNWSNHHLGSFMCFFGPLSSIFDIITFLFLYFIFCPLFTNGLLYSELTDIHLQTIYISLFQTGWFLESMWSQILILQIKVLRNNIEIILTPKEFDILYFLAKNKGEVFTKEQIYQAVWEEDFLLSDNNIMAFIRKLRKKIEPQPDSPEYIITILGIGYKFNENI